MEERSKETGRNIYFIHDNVKVNPPKKQIFGQFGLSKPFPIIQNCLNVFLDDNAIKKVNNKIDTFVSPYVKKNGTWKFEKYKIPTLQKSTIQIFKIKNHDNAVVVNTNFMESFLTKDFYKNLISNIANGNRKNRPFKIEKHKTTVKLSQPSGNKPKKFNNKKNARTHIEFVRLLLLNTPPKKIQSNEQLMKAYEQMIQKQYMAAYNNTGVQKEYNKLVKRLANHMVKNNTNTSNKKVQMPYPLSGCPLF